MALAEDFTAIFGKSKLNGGEDFTGPAVIREPDTPNKMPPNTPGDTLNTTPDNKPAGDMSSPRAPGDLGPFMDDPDPDKPDTNDDNFLMSEKNSTGNGDTTTITMHEEDGAGGIGDLDGRGSQISGITTRFGETDNVDGAGLPPPDDNVDAEADKTDFNNVKHLTQGMMDVALLSANANQLRTVLESSNVHPYYHSSIVLISLSLFCQVAVGITLIMDYQFHLTNQPQKAKTVSRYSMFGIFLIIIINVFIAAFSVATPVVYRTDTGTGTGNAIVVAGTTT